MIRTASQRQKEANATPTIGDAASKNASQPLSTSTETPPVPPHNGYCATSSLMPAFYRWWCGGRRRTGAVTSEQAERCRIGALSRDRRRICSSLRLDLQNHPPIGIRRLLELFDERQVIQLRQDGGSSFHAA